MHLFMEWFLVIAGTLFGGGMLGKLIEFFIKRYDEKKKSYKEVYLKIHKKLCSYSQDLQNIFLDSVKNCTGVKEDVRQKLDIVRKYKEEIKRLDSQIKRQESKCKKQKTNNDNCIECDNKRKRRLIAYDAMQKELNESDLLLQQLKYWAINDDVVCEIIVKYTSLHNYILACNVKNNKIYKGLENIDFQTSKMLMGIYRGEKENFADLLIKQIENIDKVLVLISKEL